MRIVFALILIITLYFVAFIAFAVCVAYPVAALRALVIIVGVAAFSALVLHFSTPYHPAR